MTTRTFDPTLNIVEINTKAYFKREKNKKPDRWYDHYVYKTRPACKLNEESFIFKKGYQLTLSLKEQKNIIDISTISGKSLYNREALNILSKYYFNNERMYTLNGSFIEINNRITTDITFLIFLENDKELLTPNKADIKKQNKVNEDEANQKVLDTFFKPNIDALAAKHGMRVYGNSITFISEESFKEYMFKCLESTIGQELTTLGLEYKLNKRWRKFRYSNEIIDLKKVKPSFNKGE